MTDSIQLYISILKKEKRNNNILYRKWRFSF